MPVPSIVFLTMPTSGTGSMWRVITALAEARRKPVKISELYANAGRVNELADWRPEPFDHIYLYNTPYVANLSLRDPAIRIITNFRDPRDMVCNQFHWASQHPIVNKSEAEIAAYREKIARTSIDEYALQIDNNLHFKGFHTVSDRLHNDTADVLILSYNQLCLDFDNLVARLAAFLDVAPDAVPWPRIELERTTNLKHNPAWIGQIWTGTDVMPGRYRHELKPETIRLLDARYRDNLGFIRSIEQPQFRHFLKTDREPEVIFEDENIRVIHRPGATPWALITFNVIDFKVEARNFWGDRFIEKTDISTFGFVSRKPNWFPAASMGKAVAAIGSYLAVHPERVMYGHSQGGYAALKYAALLGATTVISSCPHATIDPREVPDDTRFHRYYRLDLHDGMHIGAGVTGSVFILYDPFEAVESMHVARILPFVPDARLVPVYLTQDSAISAFSGTEAAQALVAACRRDDLAAVKRLARQGRRHHWRRVRGAVLAATLRGIGWADRIMRRFGHLLPTDNQTSLPAAQATLLQSMGKFADAEQMLLRTLRESPENEGCLRRLVAVCGAQQNYEAALSYAERRVAAAPTAEAFDQLAGTLSQLNRPAEAAISGAKAIALAPEDPRFRRRTSIALVQAGNPRDALEHAEKAVSLEPLNPGAHRLLAEILMSIGQPSEAIKALEQGVRLLPANRGLQALLAQTQAQTRTQVKVPSV